MNKSNRFIRRFAVRFAAVAIASAAMSASAGVCKIGNTEYDTLQEAFNSKTSASADFTVTLLKDIDVTSSIHVPSFNKKVCTVDGNGHAIRQAYAGRLFHVNTSQSWTYIKFTNVTILGGGEECSTADTEIYGTFFYMPNLSDASSLTLDQGCVISNFVMYGALIGGAANDAPKWNYYVKPGVVIAHNWSKVAGCVFHIRKWGGSTGLRIEGGEFYDNSATTGTILCFNSVSSADRTSPTLIISGGSIHDNVARSFDASASSPSVSSLFYSVDANKRAEIQMTGGMIFDNDAAVFGIYGASSTKAWFVHISGGQIFGNLGCAVVDSQSRESCDMLLSGNAIVAGNGSNGRAGLCAISEWMIPERTALAGDFTGFAYLTGTGETSYRNVGHLYGTNLASYAGAENIHQSGSKLRVLSTVSETGELVWQEPNSAKIGSTEYASFEAALAAATDGATIELMRDCLLDASIVPPANKAITVDGAGYRMFRYCKDPLVNATAAGGNMTFTNVELNEGYFTCRDAYTNHVDGVVVRTVDGVAATVTLGPGTVLSGGRGTNALVRVASGATVNLDGCVITGAVNRAVAASAGGTLGVKGATLVKDNAGGDIDVEDGNILALNGNLTGSLHVTVAGAEAFDGQKFGTKTGDWTGEENFINGGNDPKLHVSTSGILAWCHRGTIMIFR